MIKKSPANSRILLLMFITKLTASISTPSTMKAMPMEERAWRDCLNLLFVIIMYFCSKDKFVYKSKPAEKGDADKYFR